MPQIENVGAGAGSSTGESVGAGVGVTSSQPSYTPPANEPQGLDPNNEAASKTPEPQKPTEGKVIKLPPSIKPPAKTGRFQARISDLVGQRDMVERENAQLRERLSRMGAIPRTEQPAQVGKVAAANFEAPAGDALNPEDFQTYGEYVKAMVEQTLRSKEESEKSSKAKAMFEEHRQERLSSFNEQAAPLAAEYGDGFWDSITDPSLPISEAMADAVLELDALGPYTMLYLAAHKDEAARISKLNPRAATIAIGRLAAQLDFEIKQTGEVAGEGESASQVNNLTPTNAAPSQVQPQAPKPTPVPSIRGSAPTSLDNAPNDKDSVEEWLRKETDRLRRQNPNAKFYGAR